MNKFNLVKADWTSEDIKMFTKHISEFKATINLEFTKRVYNTQKECLAIKIPILRNVANEIFKGNYLSFIENCPSTIIELNLIKGMLICKINNINLKLKLLFEYAKNSDSWCETDIIKFKILQTEEDLVFNEAIQFLKSEFVFVRRLGIVLLFNFIKSEIFINKMYDEIIKLKNENEYYVNMAISWLLCECFAMQRNLTLNFIKNNINNLNDFVLKKFVNKCKDSFRIKEEDKLFLKLFVKTK